MDRLRLSVSARPPNHAQYGRIPTAEVVDNIEGTIDLIAERGLPGPKKPLSLFHSKWPSPMGP
jgi:hypothetical protein